MPSKTAAPSVLPRAEQPSGSLAPSEAFDPAQLQNALNYRLVHKTLKSAGIASIVWGVIGAVAFAGIQASFLNGILGFLGLLLIAEGIWMLRSPTPGGLIADAITLLIIGASNIVTAAAGAVGNFAFPVILLGVWQIVWGFKSVRRYKQWSAMPTSKPCDEALKQLDDLVKTISKAEADQLPDYVALQARKAFPVHQVSVWKGRLSPRSAVFVEGAGEDVVVATKDDVVVAKVEGWKGKVLSGKMLAASLRIRDRKLTGLIAPECFERLVAWKAQT